LSGLVGIHAMYAIAKHGSVNWILSVRLAVRPGPCRTGTRNLRLNGKALLPRQLLLA
jgi:hypothetical protein